MIGQHIQKLTALLNSPFPGTCDSFKVLRIMAFSGLFVASFLYIFRPFGLVSYEGNLLLLASWFGLATVVSGFSYFLFVTYVVRVRQDDPSFLFWKWILYTLGLILVIASSNYLIILFLYAGELLVSWKIFSNMLIATASIGIFPISLSGLIKYHRNRNHFLNRASEISISKTKSGSDAHEVITLPSKYAEDFSCSVEDIFAVESQDNYVAVRHRSNGDLKITMIRNTLANIEERLPSSVFFRCHRSFITNLTKIDHVSGNAQGLVIEFNDVDLKIPVSRSYIKGLKSALS